MVRILIKLKSETNPDLQAARSDLTCQHLKEYTANRPPIDLSTITSSIIIICKHFWAHIIRRSDDGERFLSFRQILTRIERSSYTIININHMMIINRSSYVVHEVQIVF